MAKGTQIEDLDFLTELIDTPDPPKTTRAKKPKDTRDSETWFKLPHIIGRCLDCQSTHVERGYTSEENPELSFPDSCLDCKSENVKLHGTCSQGDDCVGLVLHGKGPERVTAIVNDMELCRHCFLEGVGHVGD